jgi:6-phosphogluconate dehydrogenase
MCRILRASIERHFLNLGRESLMDIGFVGLGKMGLNMVTRLQRAGHQVTAYDRSADALANATAAAASVRPHSRIWCSGSKPLVLSGSWSLRPADRRNGAAVTALLAPGDVIIDGGNTRFHDDVRRSKELAAKLQYIDAGTSGEFGV